MIREGKTRQGMTAKMPQLPPMEIIRENKSKSTKKKPPTLSERITKLEKEVETMKELNLEEQVSFLHQEQEDFSQEIDRLWAVQPDPPETKSPKSLVKDWLNVLSIFTKKK